MLCIVPLQYLAGIMQVLASTPADRTEGQAGGGQQDRRRINDPVLKPSWGELGQAGVSLGKLG